MLGVDCLQMSLCMSFLSIKASPCLKVRFFKFAAIIEPCERFRGTLNKLLNLGETTN